MMVFNGCVWEGMTSLGPRPEQRRLESEAGGSSITGRPAWACSVWEMRGLCVHVCACVCAHVRVCARARVCVYARMCVHLVLHGARGRRLPAQWGRQDLGAKTRGSRVRRPNAHHVPLCATPSARGSGEQDDSELTLPVRSSGYEETDGIGPRKTLEGHERAVPR